MGTTQSTTASDHPQPTVSFYNIHLCLISVTGHRIRTPDIPTSKNGCPSSQCFYILYVVSDPREALLLVTQRNQIISDNISANPNVIEAIINDGVNIAAVDFDTATNRIYWADTSQKMIWSALRNGTDRKLVGKQHYQISQTFTLQQFLLYSKAAE